jgi:hypothetical protein
MQTASKRCSYDEKTRLESSNEWDKRHEVRNESIYPIMSYRVRSLHDIVCTHY